MATKAELQAKLDSLAERQDVALQNVLTAIADLRAQVNADPSISLDFTRLDAATAAFENADGVDGPAGPADTPPVV